MRQILWIVRHGGCYTTPIECPGCLLKVMSNRGVFSLVLKIACDGQDWTSLSKEFHTAGETNEKDHHTKEDDGV